MLLLSLRNADIPEESRPGALEHFRAAVSQVSKSLQPIVSTTRTEQAKLIGVVASDLEYGYGPVSSNPLAAATNYLDCEIFVAEGCITVLALERENDDEDTSFYALSSPRSGAGAESRPKPLPGKVKIFGMGKGSLLSILDQVSETVSREFGLEVKPSYYTNSRFNELKSEVSAEEIEIDAEKLNAARLLADAVNRKLATAIKSSGGLLLSDAAKQLPDVEPERVEEIKRGLIDAGLVSTEFVVICSSSNAQVVRVDRKDLLPELADKGLKCACGKPISEERPQELLSITAPGRFLLDKSRWMSILLKQMLIDLCVRPGDILFECQLGGDEIDCIANVSGELVMFELKDKEFNLGNAYSFGAKMGLIRPMHAIVIATAHVGNDVKEHFQRSIGSARRRSYDMYPSDGAAKISYIEGMENVERDLAAIVSKIYQGDATGILEKALPLMTLSPKALLSLVGSRTP